MWIEQLEHWILLGYRMYQRSGPVESLLVVIIEGDEELTDIIEFVDGTVA